MHRIMLADVGARFDVPKPLAHIQRHPELIASLATYHAAAAAIPKLGLQLVSLNLSDYTSIAATAAAHSLLTDDASTAALMKREALPFLITNDDDFDLIPAITVCKPR